MKSKTDTKKKTTSTDVDRLWFERFNELSETVGVDGVTYALVTAKYGCSNSTIKHRLPRWKAIQAEIGQLKIPAAYGEACLSFIETAEQLVGRKLTTEIQAHKQTQQKLIEAQKHSEVVERLAHETKRSLTAENERLKKALDKESEQRAKLEKLTAEQTLQLRERGAIVEQQAARVNALEKASKSQELSLAMFRKQLEDAGLRLERARATEDRLNQSLDAERQRVKQLEKQLAVATTKKSIKPGKPK